MWTKLDDALLDHRKVFDAGDRLGKDGPALAIGLYVIGLLWANKQLSDGFLPTAVVKRFRHVDRPLAVAAALAEAHLWEEVEGGYRIHDYHEWNYSAEQVNERRKFDRERKRVNGSKGGRKHAGHRK